MGRDISKVLPVDPAKITEFVDHSWYDYSDNEAGGKHPFKGETNPKYTGPKPPFEFLDVDKKYSWLKAPRYDGKAMEVGPLARMVVGYAAGQKDIKAAVDGVLKKLNAPATVLFSTLGRIAARALEAQIMANQLEGWVDELASNMAHGKTAIFNPIRWDPATWPSGTSGYGWHEAPRGALGHWVEIEGKSIKNYQAVVPTTWNAGPRDAKGQRGAYEAALLSTPVADPARPLEVLRTVHSFDPCIACAVHVVDAKGREYTIPIACGLGGIAMLLAPDKIDPGPDLHHPRLAEGKMVAVYVWQYPLRLVHWGLVISIGVLSFTGYYIHDPFIIGQIKWPFLMGWFRFVHEAFGMLFIALFLTAHLPVLRRKSLGGLAALRAAACGSVEGDGEGDKFYLFINPKAVSKIGHNAMAAFSYIALYGLVLVEIRDRIGDVQLDRHNAIAGPLAGWIPSLVNIQNIRLIHFFLMFVFISLRDLPRAPGHADLARGKARPDG